jgi:hypothetical protein
MKQKLKLSVCAFALILLCQVGYSQSEKRTVKSFDVRMDLSTISLDSANIKDTLKTRFGINDDYDGFKKIKILEMKYMIFNIF